MEGHMSISEKVSTGIAGFDRVIDYLRLGDNVVWQVDDIYSYKKMVDAFVTQARLDKRRIVYVRFGGHQRIVDDSRDIKTYCINADRGFESFATEVHQLIKEEGRKVFYVFDCLSDLLKDWHSDLMIGNFFRVTCPYLFELDTVAYFALIRNNHTNSTIAGIRETTQLLLDLYHSSNKLYIHPLKVWQRYSPTMFFPHLIKGQDAVGITSSSEAAALFSSLRRNENRQDYWNTILNNAAQLTDAPPEQQEGARMRLLRMLIGHDTGMARLSSRYLSLDDILKIASREIGTGFIGGKSVGMLVARKIIETEAGEYFNNYIEPHDSFFIGSDVFYTYIVQNGWWRLRVKQKTMDGYFKYASELKSKLLQGKFPMDIREQFVQVLEYFGQSPIIVRSSSLLEDNFGNAFAGKYESVFCVNQGSPEERYEAFENAVRTVYASTMDEDALAYRLKRNLVERDEQMAILVQRVSGDQYGDYFFPHAAGVGNSSNLYVWDKNADMDAGMLRLVFGLGTRAVDRTVSDYVRLVCLDDPLRMPPMDFDDIKKYSQHGVDVLSLRDNTKTEKDMEEILSIDLKADSELFASLDLQAVARLAELGFKDAGTPHILDFRKLLAKTDFPKVMRDLLRLLSQIYDYPVDVEFTANFTGDGHFRINLVQCRPLQTRGLGKAVELPEPKDASDCFFSGRRSFMGGNVRLPVEMVILVKTRAYMELNEQGKYAVARQIGMLNKEINGKNAMLIGPGRWGSTTASLGVPVRFAELCNMTAICEVASVKDGFMPELSYGCHFFQDLVESGIFYAAIYDGSEDAVFNPEYILKKENLLSSILPHSSQFSDVIHVARTDGMEVYSDIAAQRFICR